MPCPAPNGPCHGNHFWVFYIRGARLNRACAAAKQPCVKLLSPLVLLVFGRPLVKRFVLRYRSVVLSVLSVTFVHCGQTVGRIKMKLGMQVGLVPGHIVLDGDQPPQFSAHVYCGQTAGWIKMPLGTKVGLSQATLC